MKNKIKTAKTLYIYLLIGLSTFIQASTNEKLLNYFEKIYLDEKNSFIECLELEALPDIDKIYTECRLTESFNDAAYILYDNNDVYQAHIELLEQFNKFKKLKNPAVRYPKQMLRKGQSGYVVIKFDLSETGKTENHEVLDGMCGDNYNPLTEFKPCSGFNSSAMSAAKLLKYEPTTFQDNPIRHNGLLHRFTFSIEQSPRVEIKKGLKTLKAYNKLIRHLANGNFTSALEIANQNIDNDEYFIYQKAVIKFNNAEFEQSIDLLKDFSKKTTSNNREIKEEYLVTGFSMRIASLFNLGLYDEVIGLEKNYKMYSSERQKYKNLLSMTNFYIGIAFVNSGNIPKGAFYLTLASRSASSQAQSDYYDSFIEQISSYL